MTKFSYSPRMISCLVREAGWKQAQIAEILGISQGAVSYGIQTGASPRVTAWVSELLGVSQEILWPQRFMKTKPASGAKRNPLEQKGGKPTS